MLDPWRLVGLIFSDLGSFANTLIIALPAAGGQRSAGDSTATTRGLRSTRDQEPTTAAGNAGRPWHLGQGEGGILDQENNTTPCHQDLTEKQVQKMQVNISPRPEKPTIYFSGFDKRTGAELAGRLGRETCLACLIASIYVAGFDQATGERNAGASHNHYHANVNFESRRWLRARVFPSVFLQLQMLSHPVFPRSKKFQNIRTKIAPVPIAGGQSWGEHEGEDAAECPHHAKTA